MVGHHQLYARCILLFVICISTQSVVLNTSSLRDEIVETLFADYQSHVRPGELTRSQTVVTVYISISAITSVDVRDMQYTMDLMLRQAWFDPRLAWNHIPQFAHYTKNIVSPVFKDKIWLPDLFFRNGKEGRLHKMTCDNLLIRIQPDGEVLYSQKITMRLACQMDLHTFPMDTQECDMNIGSYGYTLNQLRFVWRNYSPVSLPENLQISEFDPPKTVTALDCSSLYATSTGKYTCLNATFVLSRQIGYWLASTYIPNILIMVVSWLNFWVSLEATPARVNLSLLTLLGVVTQSTSYASTLPRVSYIKAIDVWTNACITFNSGVLLEFAIASHLSRRRKLNDWQMEIRKLVRKELIKWCTACQQQYHKRGPSALVAYSTDSDVHSKTLQFFDTAVKATHQARNGIEHESGAQMSVHLTRSGLASGIAKERGNNGNFSFPKKVFDEYEKDEYCATPIESLLPLSDKRAPVMSGRVSEIDCYSRFIFPACFLVYNCFYWLYYLVIVKRI